MQYQLVLESEGRWIQDGSVGVRHDRVVRNAPRLVTNNAAAMLAGGSGAVTITVKDWSRTSWHLYSRPCAFLPILNSKAENAPVLVQERVTNVTIGGDLRSSPDANCGEERLLETHLIAAPLH